MTSVAGTLRRAITFDSGTSVALRLPPRPTRPLIGRDEIIESILVHLKSDSGGHRLLIHGPSGVGKTAIALDVAHRISRTSLYDITIWIDCQQIVLTGDEIHDSITALRDLSDISREIAIALSDDEALRRTKRERLQILQTRLSMRKCLVLIDALDSVPDPEVEQFVLKLPHTVDVIATSRKKLQWHSQKEIQPLTGRSAADLLSRQLEIQGLSVDPTLITTLLNISNGIPRTSEWLVHLLSKGVSASELSRELNKPNASISKYYFESHGINISKNTSLLRASLLIALAAAIRKCDAVDVLNHFFPEQGALGLLKQLDEIHVVVIKDEYVDMLPSLRSYLLNSVGERYGTIISVACDWIEHLILRVTKARSASTWQEVFHNIEGFRPELLRALRLIGSTTDENLLVQGAKLLNLSSYYFYSTGLWDELVDGVQWAIPLEVKRGNIEPVMEMGLTWAVRVYGYRQGIRNAQQFFEETSRILRQKDETSSETILFLRVAKSFLRSKNSGDLGLALELAKDADRFKEVGNYEWACRAMLQAGNIWSEGRELELANEAFVWVQKEASLVPICPWVVEMLALSTGNRGIIENRLGNFERAVPLLKESLEGISQAYDLATALGEIARAYYYLTNFGLAKKYVIQCLRHKEKLGVKDSVVESEPGWEKDIGLLLVGRSNFALWVEGLFSRAKGR